MCNNKFILTISCQQVSMARYGFDIPSSKKPVNAIRRSMIFDIVSQYCFSEFDEEIVEIETYSQHIKDVWLQTFTNSQSVMMRSKVLQSAKEYFCKYFPIDGAAPKASLGKKIGLSYRESILDRYMTVMGNNA